MTAPVGLPPTFGEVLNRPQPAPAPRIDGESSTGVHGPDPSGTPVTPFVEHLEHIVEGVDQAQKTAEQQAVDFAEHRSNDLHGTMISLGEADIQLRFATSIRNKVIEAYREVMRMGA